MAELEGYVNRGEFVQAICEGERLRMFPDLSPQQKGRLFRLMGRARAESGDPYSALKLLELAIPSALRARDWDTAGKARAELGIAYLQVGDIPNALDNLHAYLLDLHRYRDAGRYLGAVHFHLGLTYRRRKDHDKSTYHYSQALEWFSERGYTIQAGWTHQNLAWLYCLEGKAEEAEAELTIAETFSEVCGPEFRVEQLVCRALLSTVRKQLEPAIRLAQEVLQPGRPGVTHLHRAYAAWIYGSVCLAVRFYDEADYYAALATQQAIEAKEPDAMNQAIQLKAEIDRRRKSTDEAAG